MVPLTQAVDQLNLKPKSLRDLLTDEPFTRKDIIHIQVGQSPALSASVRRPWAPLSFGTLNDEPSVRMTRPACLARQHG